MPTIVYTFQDKKESISLTCSHAALDLATARSKADIMDRVISF